ncbi:MAG: VWA domain-containing protein [Acidimicrobiia bacterium]
MSPGFPFSAVVAGDDAKLALVLAAVDPAIGGVLLRGEKGSAKSTLARGLAELLPGAAPFTELPLGASEERVVGSIDLAAALRDAEVRFQPGLLAAAHGGVLYVDEVNLLADHLVDVLLDVAVTGHNRVERDNVSHEHAARFVLIGSMNPEEGDLRPQLLDRFGLAVDVRAPAPVEDRVEVVRRRLAFDADPAAFAERWAGAQRALAERLAAARPASVDDAVLGAASELAVEAGAEGMRADLVLTRAAAAHAGWAGRAAATLDDLRAVAAMVLVHRARRHPLEPPGTPPDLDAAVDRVLGPEGGSDPPAGGAGASAGGGDGDGDGDREGDDRGAGDEGGDGDGSGEGDGRGAGGARVAPAGPPTAVARLEAPRATQSGGGGRRSTVIGDRGRAIGHRAPSGPVASVAAVPTLAAAAARRALDPGAAGRIAAGGIAAGDLREAVREARTGNLLVLAVDASGSMGADARMAAVKGALCGLLVDAYQRRDRVALVTFAGDAAEVALRPTGSVEVARTRLESLPTGGATPLAEGIRLAADVAARATTATLRPLLVLVTDGRATSGADPVADAMAAAATVARRGLPSVVIDVEAPGPGGLGLAVSLARAMGARHLRLPDLTAGRLEATLRTL